MKYYPVCLDLKNKRCAVVGGGKVAERKARTLLRAKAKVRVISPAVTAGLAKLWQDKKIVLIKSDYQKKFLKGSFLVIAATDDKKVNRAVSRDAAGNRILTNVVDVPDSSDFIVPSLIEKKGLLISISTSGKAPCLAKKIRIDLSRKFIPAYARVLNLLESLRKRLKDPRLKGINKKVILKKLIDSGILKRYADKDPGIAAKEILKKVFAKP